MALRLVQVNFKARDDSALGQFWAQALDWSVSSEGPGVTNVEPRGFVWPDPVAVCIDVVSVPDPETVKYRAHLDLATSSLAHQAELVSRLERLGATPADIGQGDVPWTVMADPEGNVFCVLEPRSIYQDTGPIATVVVHCADPRSLARFWNEATDWSLHEVTGDFASLRSATGVGPAAPPLSTSARGDVPWVVLADTEGNEFCVLTPGRCRASFLLVSASARRHPRGAAPRSCATAPSAAHGR